jgi:two-component system nitrogen regulation sensor histidine kinase GlnL
MRDLGHVIDALISGVVVIDAGGTVREMNTEACRILETSAESARRQPVEATLGPLLAKLVRGVLASSRGVVENEIRIERRFSAAPLVAEIAISPFHEPSGHADGVVVEIRDRSIHSELRDAAFERERMHSFGRIAAGIAHEVKNPLGGIRGAAEIVAKRSEDPRFVERAQLVIRETDRIASLLDDFMVLGREESLRPRDVNLHRVLDDVIDLNDLDPLSEGIRIERLYDPSIPELYADHDRLAQVFHNLVRNALQAMAGATGDHPESRQGDRLEIRTRVDFDHPLSRGDGPRVASVSIEIIDSGPGIADDLFDRITDPFFTTRETGTGLGLSIAQHWVSAHGGRLVLENAPTGGTCARVTLPLRTSRSNS